jgi:NhaP-type Na+/H+ and K+/H+ antiporter
MRSCGTTALPRGRVDVLLRLLLLIVGVGALLLAAHLPIVNIGLERVMEWALRRWTRLNVRDYIRLLNLAGEYTVTEMHVEQGDWVEGKQLQQCDLGNEGVTVLGIRREDGSYVGAPRGSTNIHPGDVLVLYGRSEPLENLDKRREGGAGDAAHEQAKQEQQQEMARQDAQEQQHEQKRQQDTAESLAGPAGRNRKHAP